jgi:Holliday junction resolvase RusA-like endonuclease
MKEWRAAIACEARAWLAANGAPAPLDCAVSVSVTFYLPKPKSASKRVQYPATRPDADKLVRCVNDSLTGIAYTDDSRIVNLSVQKRFAIDSPPRAEIAIEQTGELVA